MEAKHTPGPWVVWPHLDSYHIRGAMKNIAFTNQVSPSHMGKEEQANARLIAAAPNMLAALRAIVARINGVWDDPDLMLFGPLSTNALADVEWIAKETIAKARGAG